MCCMDLFSIIAYVGAISLVFYLCLHLFFTIIRRKTVKPGWASIIYFLLLYLCIGMYVIARKDYPLIIIISVFLVWGILGMIDKIVMSSRAKRSRN